MKLNDRFLIHRAEGKTFLVPAGGSFAGIVKGNDTFGEILSQLEKGVTEAALIQELAARYEAPVEQITRDVKQALQQLRSIGAIDD